MHFFIKVPIGHNIIDNYIQVCTDFPYSTRVHIKGQRVRIAENRDIPFI
jgi:hypothetical protein